MHALVRHPLVSNDLRDAYDWYENQQAGLGNEFARDFLRHYGDLVNGPELYAVRFADVRRLNLDRFPYGLFYTIRVNEIWLLAVLHASRDTKSVLAERRKHFR